MPVPAENGQGQPNSTREPVDQQPKPSVREQFEARLLREREPVKGQPSEPEARKVQTPLDEKIDDLEEGLDDDVNIVDPESPGDEGEEQDDDDFIEALMVGDRQYTAEDVEKLEKQNREYDADYRRKTQSLARVRQEYQAKGQEYEEIGGFFKQLTEVNLRNLRNVDPSTLTQEQFGVWRQQLMAAEQGASQLNQAIEGVRKKIAEDRNKMLDQQAAESAEILKSEFKDRWGNEFYGKLRDFAVKSQMYDPKEFADITDWRVMKGLVALYDAAEVKKVVTKDPNDQNDGKPTRRQLQRARRSQKTGKFVNTQQAVRESPNPRQDGTLRNHFMERLAKERGGNQR